MGPFVIHPRAFPLHLFLCPLGGRGRGYRSVMEVDCGTRKSRQRGRRGWGASLRAMVVVMVVVNGRQRTVVVGPERAECLRKGGEGKRSGPVARGWRHARAAVCAVCTRTVFVLASRGQKRIWLSVVVLGDVVPVTWLRRAVTHCDRACTNIQRPNSPHNLQVLHYPDCCSLLATTATTLSSSPPFVRNISHPCRLRAPANAHSAH